MIIGLGEDLVEIARIEKLMIKNGDHFLNKCFTPFEIEKGNLHSEPKRRISYYAKRFAAKEACLKALGTGMREGIFWHDMEVSNDDLGRPLLSVFGGVQDKLHQLCPNGHQPIIHVTLSDEAGLAKATVILESL